MIKANQLTIVCNDMCCHLLWVIKLQQKADSCLSTKTNHWKYSSIMKHSIMPWSQHHHDTKPPPTMRESHGLMVRPWDISRWPRENSWSHREISHGHHVVSHGEIVTARSSCNKINLDDQRKTKGIFPSWFSHKISKTSEVKSPKTILMRIVNFEYLNIKNILRYIHILTKLKQIINEESLYMFLAATAAQEGHSSLRPSPRLILGDGRSDKCPKMLSALAEIGPSEVCATSGANLGRPLF